MTIGDWRSPSIAALLALGGCCGAPTGQCLPWVQLGETYELEVLEPYTVSDPLDMSQKPYNRFRAPVPCGTHLDGLAEGVRFTMEVVRDNGERDDCTATCVSFVGEPSIEGVRRLRIPVTFRGLSVGEQALADAFRAELGSGECLGEYRIGVAQVRPSFPGSVPSDHMLFRHFSVRDDEQREACGIPDDAGGYQCWDTWSVRIRDSSGELVTGEFAAQ